MAEANYGPSAGRAGDAQNWVVNLAACVTTNQPAAHPLRSAYRRASGRSGSPPCSHCCRHLPPPEGRRHPGEHDSGRLIVILTLCPKCQVRQDDPRWQWAHLGTVAAGWVSGLARAVRRTIWPLVARASGLAGLLPCCHRWAATRHDGIYPAGRTALSAAHASAASPGAGGEKDGSGQPAASGRAPGDAASVPPAAPAAPIPPACQPAGPGRRRSRPAALAWAGARPVVMPVMRR
jgi:hypothetical protein